MPYREIETTIDAGPPAPWCGVDRLKDLHAPFAAKSFPGARYIETRFDPGFDKWVTVYENDRGEECLMIELWQDPEGKTARTAVRKPRGALN